MRSLARPALRAVVETVFLLGLLGFLYSAAWGVFRPAGMSSPVTAIVPTRRDTFGVLCVAASVVSAFLLQIGTGQLLIRRPRRRGAIDAALRTVVGYGLLVWSYLCANSLTHPNTIGRRLVHFSASPAEGTAAVMCFAVSAAGFFVLRLRQLSPGTSGS